jgi:hypothetical protein
MIRAQNKRAVLMVLWVALICCAIAGSVLHGSSPLMMEVARMHINDKVLPFCAYVALPWLPVIGFRDMPRERRIAHNIPANGEPHSTPA